MKRFMFPIFFIIILSNSCVLNKHYYRCYETFLPHFNDYEKISKENFGEYFYDDIYFYLACYPTNYYPQKIREDAPCELMLYCITKNKKYTLVSIDNMSISSNLKNNYVSNNKSRLGFNFYYKDKKNIDYYRSFYLEGEKTESFNFDHVNEELITIQIDISIQDDSNTIYEKQLTYILQPTLKVGYFDLLTDLF